MKQRRFLVGLPERKAPPKTWKNAVFPLPTVVSP